MERIEESKFNRWYKRVKEAEVPGYLKKGWGESRWRRRDLDCCEMRESNYWEEKEKKMYKLCGRERESWKHVWEVCRLWKEREEGNSQEMVGMILGEEGEGEGWMRELERERGGMNEKESDRERKRDKVENEHMR